MEVPLHRRLPLGVAPGWKPPSQRLADEIGREYVNLGGLARTNVRKVLTPPWRPALGRGSTPWTTKPGGGSP